MSDYLIKSVYDLDLGKDSPIALLPEVCSRAASINRFSIVVTPVNPRNHNLQALIRQMPRVWGFPEACVGRLLDGDIVQFRFQSDESMNLVLHRGPWSFNDWMVTTHRWFPNISENAMKIIPFWVQIQVIPILYLTISMARWIGNRLGNVYEVDYDENVNQVGVVRVRIDWNIDDPLRFQKNLRFAADENSLVKFCYERLRNFCNKCGSLKHDAKDCSLSFSDSDPEESDNESDGDHHFDDNNNMSKADTLPSFNMATHTPGLHMSGPIINKLVQGNQVMTSSDLPSVFEDTELTVEHIRYLHAKYVGKFGYNPMKMNMLEENSDNVVQDFVVMKQKRVKFESEFNKAEAAEELAVLCQLRKKGKHTDSENSYSVNKG